MYGYATPEEMIAAVTDIAAQVYVDPGDREVFKRLLEERGQVVNHESRFRRKDGTILWVSRTARVVRNKDGLVVAYQGFTTDSY
jgi:PAS domain S-box-containing protein